MHILVVEDSKFFARAVVKGLSAKFHAQVSVASNRAEALELLDKSPFCFDFALVDVILPDSDQGEVVDDVLSYEIPTVVFTGVISPELRERLIKKPIIDYVMKDSPSSLNYLVSLMARLVKNTTTEVLVVDDSRSFRMHITRLLKRYRLTVHEAYDAAGALEKLAHNPRIRMAIVDQNMPKMTGVELIKRIRKTNGPDDLSIIGMSSSTNSDLSVQFIKYGANDYLSKDFLHEEFFCRVSQNLNMLDMLQQLKEAATTDFLTGLRNRNFFFGIGEQLLAAQSRGQVALTTAMMDLDHFKSINDTYGHDVGDIVLKKVAKALRKRVRDSDVIARLGGEEFALILVNMDPSHAESYFEKLRSEIQSIIVESDGKRVPISCSIGVVDGTGSDLDAVLKLADDLLYVAKKNGRNRVEFCKAFGSDDRKSLAS